MFTDLFFLILVLLLINLAPEIRVDEIPLYPFSRFLSGMLAYCGVLLLIISQNYVLKKTLHRHKKRLRLLAAGELITFLSLYYFVFDSPAWFNTIPFIGSAQSIGMIFSLILYLFGLGVFHMSAERAGNRAAYAWADKPSTALSELRLLLPFTFPFLIFTLSLDILQLFPASFFSTWFNSDEPAGSAAVFGVTVLFMIGMLIFLPPLILKAWQCISLEQGTLRTHLEKVCEKAGFRYADIKIWTVMNRSLTAAILGVIPRFRYLIFTRRLLDEMPLPYVEAVLVHEIGHHYRRHLLIYPLILAGLLAATGLFSVYLSSILIEGLKQQETADPSLFWDYVLPVEIFAAYGLIVLAYFRIVFGFFSRLFERQADLHVFQLGVDPQSLIDALDFVGTASGGIHKIPDWHHYGIQERMDFLAAANADPALIDKHHRYVKKALISYCILLGIAGWLLVASSFPAVSLFKSTAAFNTRISLRIHEQIVGRQKNKTQKESKNSLIIP